DTLLLWEVASGACVRTHKAHQWGVHSVAFSPDGRFVLSGSREDTLRLWEVSSGECLRSFDYTGGRTRWRLAPTAASSSRGAMTRRCGCGRCPAASASAPSRDTRDV